MTDTPTTPLYTINLNKRGMILGLVFMAALYTLVLILVPDYWTILTKQWPNEPLATKIVLCGGQAVAFIAYGFILSAALSKKPVLEFYSDRIIHNSPSLRTSHIYLHDRIAAISYLNNNGTGASSFTIHYFPDGKETIAEHLKKKTIHVLPTNTHEDINHFWDNYRKHFS